MKLTKESLKDKVYNLIKERIFKKEYHLNETLVIARLTEELQVSNSPIREALSHLSSEGLVNFEGSSKYKVVNLSEEKLIEINEAVLILLNGGFETCLEENKTELLVQLLDSAYQEHKKIYDNDEEFDYKYIETSLNFDRQIVVASGNTCLINLFEYMFPMLVLASVYNKKTYKEKHMEEHSMILQSVKDKDPDRTRELLKLHFYKDLTSMNFDI
ncbi:MAG: GntR family transcriptional regulator [Tissierellia bacterium]|nr:GntR family transcriptional regulator [Tissierellia bacterium]